MSISRSNDDTLQAGAVVAEKPAAIAELNLLRKRSVTAHEAIFQLHRRLQLQDGGTEETDQLLYEAAQIAVDAIPKATAEAQRLIARWESQALVDPEQARLTAIELTAAVKTADRTVCELQIRQLEIAEILNAALLSAAN